MARGIKSFADDVLGIDPGGGGIVGSVKNIADDVLGIDPSGQGLVGSIRDNPRTAALLGTLGIGSLLYGGLGGLGSAVTGGLRSAGSALGGLGLGGLLGGVAPYAIGAGLGRSGLLGGGEREPQPQLPPLQDFGGAPIGLSGLEYASSIAGGIPFEEIVQPGREFSLAAPMGEAVAPQAPRQIPESPYRPLLGFTPGVVTGEMTGDIPEALRGVIDPRNIGLGPGGVFDPFRDGLRVTEDWDRISGGPQIPQEPLNRLADLFGIRDKRQDDGVYVGGSRDFREYDPLKDPFQGIAGRPAPIDPLREGVRPTEIFGPGGEIIGPMGRMSDVQPRSDQEIIDLIEGRLGEYQPVIPQPDLSGFARLEDIPSFVPRTDEEIRGLISEGIAGIPTPAQFDPSGLQRRLAALEGREIPQFDPSELQRRLAALEGREISEFDPSGILSRLSALEAQGEPRYTQPGTEKDIVPPRSPLGKLSLFG